MTSSNGKTFDEIIDEPGIYREVDEEYTLIVVSNQAGHPLPSVRNLHDRCTSAIMLNAQLSPIVFDSRCGLVVNGRWIKQDNLDFKIVLHIKEG